MDFLNIQQDCFYKVTQTSETDKLGLKHDSNWKVLIYDDVSFNIISNFKIGDLRENNITLHLHINEKKAELGGVDAIYFLSPTSSSIDSFIADIQQDYFEEVYLNFCGGLTKEDCEKLVNKLIETGKTTRVKQISQYSMDLFPLSKKIFTCALENTFLCKKESMIRKISDKLTDFCYFTGKLPVVIYDGESERAEAIFSLLKYNFTQDSNRYLPNPEQLTNDKRMILILNTNGMDWNPFLVHSFAYFDLIVEHFGICKRIKNFNQIKVGDEVIKLDLKNDRFLQKNAFEDFPDVSSNITEEMEVWKEKYDQITGKTEEPNDFAKKFSEALESLPEITEHKKINQNHMNIASNLMKTINQRELEKICVISNYILNYKKISREYALEIEELFKEEKVVLSDKLRLLLMIITNTKTDITKFEHYEKVLSEHETLSESQKRLIKQLKTEKFKPGTNNTTLLSMFTSKSKRMWDNVVSQNYHFSGSKLIYNLFKKKESLDKLRIQQIIPNSNQFLLSKVEDVVLFNIDGGNLSEYSELIKLEKQLNKNIYFGFSGLLTGEDVLNKLADETT